jgi:hypothetical protein
MRRDRIDVGGDDIGFDLVAQHVGARARAGDRIEQREQARRLIAVTEHGMSDDDQVAACVYWPPFSRMPGG